ncbi:ABC transporter permease [Chloroflexota bacterium]
MTTTIRSLTNWRNLAPIVFVCLFFVVAAAAPYISPPADPNNPLPFKLVDSFDINPLPPGPDIPLGTSVYYESPEMLLHYDVWHSLIWGTRHALRFGLTVAIFSAIFGILIGAFSGYTGGRTNNLVMRVTDAFLAFPLIAGYWVLAQIIKSYEWANTMYGLESVVVQLSSRQRLFAALGVNPLLLAFILFSWMPYARLINANMLRLKSTEYVLAARTIGAKPSHIVLRHLIPNAITPVIVLLARDIGGMVILLTAFEFIGIGSSITEGISEWGRLLYLGRTWIIGLGGNLLLYWWLYIPVTLALMLFGIAWNILGDRLNILINPRQPRS